MNCDIALAIALSLAPAAPTLSASNSEREPLPASSLGVPPATTLDASATSGKRKWLKYGLIGGGMCGAIGAYIGINGSTDICSSPDLGNPGHGCERDTYSREYALIGAGFGALVGGLIGLRESHRATP